MVPRGDIALVASSLVLTAKQVVRRRGGQLLLDRVSLSVGPRSRIGVVGPNGIGKSTLLRVLAGLEPPDEGVVERSPASLTVGYLAQEPDAMPGEPLRAYLARRTGVATAEADLDRLTARLGTDNSAVDDYTEALERFVALGGDDFEARAASVVAGLGLPADRFDMAVTDLSGGQAARAGLAAILLARFDVFLLDEPTNDLDFAGLDRLERFLEGLQGGVVVVSHDRAFLDRTVERIVELEEETHRAVEYAGAWSEYVAARALARGQQEEVYRKYVEERQQLTERIRTQRSWSERGIRTAGKRPRDHDKAQQGFFANRTEQQASQGAGIGAAPGPPGGRRQALGGLAAPSGPFPAHGAAGTWWPASSRRPSGGGPSSSARSTWKSAGRTGWPCWGRTAGASPRCCGPCWAIWRWPRGPGTSGLVSPSGWSTNGE